jgi:hypothetical protein
VALEELLSEAHAVEKRVAMSRARSLRGSRCRVEAEVECERTFEDPLVGRYCDQATEEQLEGNTLPKVGDAESGPRGLGLGPVVERLAECGGGRVSHRSVSRVPRTRVFRWRVGFLLELPAREQAEAQRLLGGNGAVQRLTQQKPFRFVWGRRD